MVELSRGAAIAVGGGGAAVVLVLLALLVRSARRWRSASRRLAAIATRLETTGSPAGDDRDLVGRIERHAQAAVLRLSDEEARADRLAGALDQAGVGVVVCDEQGAVVYRNGGATGLPDGPAPGAVEEVLRAAVSGHAGPERTVEVAGPPWRTVRVTGHPLDDGRRVVGAVAVVHDVSEQRRLDLVRRDFVANVTAELRSPVGALGLLAGTIVAEDDPALTRRLAARLEQDALRVGRIVDDLAELSRLDAQAFPAAEVVPVHLFVAQAVQDAAGAAVPVAVDVTGAPGGLSVVGDRRQLVSALRHLVDNAVRHAGAGTGVSVSASCTDGWLDVAVVDRGPGIPAGELDRIFETFYRGDAGRDRSPAGTGLGLSIASRVAAAHGGRVLVQSSEGTGSTFTLRIPATSSPAPSPASAEVT